MRRARNLLPLADVKGGSRLGGGKREMVLGSTLESGSGEYVRAAEGGLRLGGGGARTEDGAIVTCEDLGGGGGALSVVGLVDATGIRKGTAGTERDMGEAGLKDDCEGVGGLSLRNTGGSRRGGRGAELLVSFFPEGTGRAGTAGTGVRGVGTLGGVGSDFRMGGGLAKLPSRVKALNWLLSSIQMNNRTMFTLTSRF